MFILILIMLGSPVRSSMTDYSDPDALKSSRMVGRMGGGESRLNDLP